MEEGADSIGSAAAGPSMPELVERELEALRAVDGVTSATSQERQQRQPLNKSMVKVRLQGRKRRTPSRSTAVAACPTC